jgi:hypothetical protein
MADHTSFTQRLVFKHERAALSCVALEASLILTEQSDAAALERLHARWWRRLDCAFPLCGL